MPYIFSGVLYTSVHEFHHCEKVKLPAQSQQEILGELVGIPHLKEALDTLETVMAFLAAGVGMNAAMDLSTYATSFKIEFSSKVYIKYLRIYKGFVYVVLFIDPTTLQVVSRAFIMGDFICFYGQTACDQKRGMLLEITK